MIRRLLVAALALACASSPALAQTAAQYKNSDGSYSPGVVCMTASDGRNSTPGCGAGGANVTPNVIPTLQTAAYAAGAALGGTQTLALARTNGGSGIITSLMLQSKGGSTNTVWIYAFQKSPVSTCADKSAFSFSSADRPYLVPGFPQSVTLASPGSWDTASEASVMNLTANFKNQDSTPGPWIYFCLVTAGSVTPATTSDLIFTVGLPQD
jgi:hypothetical protein